MSYNKPMRTKVFILSIISGIIGLGGKASAAYIIKNPIKAESFGEVIRGFAQLAAQIGLPIAALFLVWSGFLFVSARGDEKQLETAKKTFFWTVIGTALIVGAYAIATAVVNFAQKL